MNKQETFLQRAENIHGTKYCYKNSVYVNANTKLSIECATHGSFLQTPYLHINKKRGCPRCAKRQRPISRRANNKWMSFTDAKKVVHELDIKTTATWHEYVKTHNVPGIPHNPRQTYSSEWEGWNDWLGTVSFRERLLPFEQAREIARSFKLRSFEEWVTHCAVKDLKPENIPFAPHTIYQEWVSWGDWLGYTSRANGNLEGIVYIIQQNDLPQNVYKIGRTYRLKQRLKEHQRVRRSKFTVIKQYSVSNMRLFEEQAHRVAMQHGEHFKYKKSKEYFIIANFDKFIEILDNMME